MNVQDEKRPTLSGCKTASPGVSLSEREVLGEIDCREAASRVRQVRSVS